MTHDLYSAQCVDITECKQFFSMKFDLYIIYISYIIIIFYF